MKHLLDLSMSLCAFGVSYFFVAMLIVKQLPRTWKDVPPNTLFVLGCVVQFPIVLITLALIKGFSQ